MMDYTISKREVNRGTAIVGKSTDNQIQCLWKDVFEGVSGLCFKLFYFMEEVQFLDPLNEIHHAAAPASFTSNYIMRSWKSGTVHGWATGCAQYQIFALAYLRLWPVVKSNRSWIDEISHWKLLSRGHNRHWLRRSLGQQANSMLSFGVSCWWMQGSTGLLTSFHLLGRKLWSRTLLEIGWDNQGSCSGSFRKCNSIQLTKALFKYVRIL